MTVLPQILWRYYKSTLWLLPDPIAPQNSSNSLTFDEEVLCLRIASTHVLWEVLVKAAAQMLFVLLV
jgi:hypothetical protein